MPARLLLGKPVVDLMIEKMNADPIDAGLVVLSVGDDAERESYRKQLERTVKRVAKLRYDTRLLAEDITLQGLTEVMESLNTDGSVSGYILQTPLPDDLKPFTSLLRERIAGSKDIECLGHHQLARFYAEKKKGQILPPTPYAAMTALKYALPHPPEQTAVQGKTMVILGDGPVGKGIQRMAGNDLATVTLCNEKTPDPARYTRDADIVVSAVGRPGIVTADMVKDGAYVINIGMKYDRRAKTMKGDVDDAMMDRDVFLSPVLGGIGPVTVAALAEMTRRAVLLSGGTSVEL